MRIEGERDAEEDDGTEAIAVSFVCLGADVLCDQQHSKVTHAREHFVSY